MVLASEPELSQALAEIHVNHSTSTRTSPKHSRKQPHSKIHTLLPPRYLALCGGGIRGICHIGVLQTLEKYKLLSCLQEVLGVSAGALFGLLVCLRYRISEIEDLTLRFDFSLLQSKDPDMALLFPITFGIDAGESLEKFVISLLKQKGFGPSATFADLEKAGCMRFRCFASEMETASIKEFSAKKTPNASVVFATRASMSIPFFYTPVRDPETGHMLLDGGLLQSCPIVYLTPEEIESSLGIVFEYPLSKSFESLQEIAGGIIDIVAYSRYREIRSRYPSKLLVLPYPGISWLHFEASTEIRKQMIQIASKKTELFLNTPSYRPMRRFSVS